MYLSAFAFEMRASTRISRVLRVVYAARVRSPRSFARRRIPFREILFFAHTRARSRLSLSRARSIKYSLTYLSHFS